MDELVRRLRHAGFAATRTHFDHTGLRTDAPPGEIRRAIHELVAAREAGNRQIVNGGEPGPL